MSGESCPCALPAAYEQCCGRLHRGEAAAETAEQLMRSRFSAFAVGDAAYLLRSWHPSTRPAEVTFEPFLRWKKLSIVSTSGGGAGDAEGTVEFRARYSQAGKAGEMREVSRFTRREGAWVYLTGEARSSRAR
ncbi:YchJ family metal-binding protein [Nonomuraea sp. NPDC049152]|uniref:YchJ family protein n=1 Tax=Nonomuraea sp. NPDC049152 TaxID=3154350 RepID=UPI0033F1B53B